MRHSLRADDSAPVRFLPLIEYFVDSFDFILICKRMQKKIIQDQQLDTTQMFLATAKLLFVCPLEKHKAVYKFLRTEVFDSVSGTGFEAYCFCEISLTAVRSTENTDIHSILNKT